MEANAKKIADRIKNAAKTWDTEKYFDRSFCNLLDVSDSKKAERIVVDFVDLYLNDRELQSATKLMSHWIPIERWEKLHSQYKQRDRSLFEEV